MTGSQRSRAALPCVVLLIAILHYFAGPAHAIAQEIVPPTGSISGMVVDASTGQPLDLVFVQLVGREAGVQTDVSGRYTLTRVPAGTVTLQFRRIGFTPLTVTGILLEAGKTFNQPAALNRAVFELSAQVITSAGARGSVNDVLASQKAAHGVVSTVSTEQIQRSTDSDGAAVAQRASGVTLQDNKSPIVRGQAERATVAQLNGTRIPSPDPERKQVPFDIFPASLIRSLDVIKTFTPDQPGDFSGAVIDVHTRDFPSSRTISYSSSLGINTSARSNVLAAPTSGSEWFAIASGNRSLPGSVRAAGNFGGRTWQQSEINSMISSFRNTWTPTTGSGTPNSSFGVSVGGNDPVLGMQVGYIGALTYSLSQEVRDDEYRALIDFGTGNSPANEFHGSTGRSSVLWGGILNASTFVGNNGTIKLSNTYSRTADSEAHRDVGQDEALGLDNLFERTTLSFVERTIRSNQLSGEHTLGTSTLDWSVSNSGVTRREPDRSDMVYVSSLDPDTQERNPFVLFATSSDGARRTFADLSETSWNFASNLSFQIGNPDYESSLKVGATGRRTHRDAEVLQYALTALAPLDDNAGAMRAEEIFDGRFTSGSQQTFTINPLGQSGSYEANDDLLAGYAMADYALSSRFRLVGGARVELSRVEVISENLFGLRQPVTRNFTDILPSVAMNVALTESQNLRVSAARTLARPEYRELSPILNRDVLGGQGFRGDTALVRTLISNFDVRWEWYPNPDELVSVALFAKDHSNPIEKVEVPTSGTSILSFINAESARNYGIEFELRKNLGTLLEVLTPFTLFSNLTLMNSEVVLGEGAAASATNPNRPLVGQAPYVVNAGLSYSSFDGRLSATALYNRVGKRINAAGPSPLPDIYEMPRDVVDFALRFPVLNALDGKLDVRNVLDSEYEMRQGPVTRLRYTAGRSLSLGLTWRP